MAARRGQCPDCKGTGTRKPDPDERQQFQRLCKRCGGTGTATLTAEETAAAFHLKEAAGAAKAYQTSNQPAPTRGGFKSGVEAHDDIRGVRRVVRGLKRKKKRGKALPTPPRMAEMFEADPDEMPVGGDFQDRHEFNLGDGGKWRRPDVAEDE